tara:strand:- start:51 stop:356 length:306 start_codon:yes stop_codon:yes gene_type:complete
MLDPKFFLIHLVIIILSIILSYIIYRYLNYDLIDISKIIKNDIEKFTISQQSVEFDNNTFSDETAYPILKKYSDEIASAINNNIVDEYDRLKIYTRGLVNN